MKSAFLKVIACIMYWAAAHTMEPQHFLGFFDAIKDEADKTRFAPIFGLTLEQTKAIQNIRFYGNYGRLTYPGKLSEVERKAILNDKFYVKHDPKKELSEYPLDYTAALLQWLFPAPARDVLAKNAYDGQCLGHILKLGEYEKEVVFSAILDAIKNKLGDVGSFEAVVSQALRKNVPTSITKGSEPKGGYDPVESKFRERYQYKIIGGTKRDNNDIGVLCEQIRKESKIFAYILYQAIQENNTLPYYPKDLCFHALTLFMCKTITSVDTLRNIYKESGLVPSDHVFSDATTDFKNHYFKLKSSVKTDTPISYETLSALGAGIEAYEEKFPEPSLYLTLPSHELTHPITGKTIGAKYPNCSDIMVMNLFMMLLSDNQRIKADLLDTIFDKISPHSITDADKLLYQKDKLKHFFSDTDPSKYYHFEKHIEWSRIVSGLNDAVPMPRDFNEETLDWNLVYYNPINNFYEFAGLLYNVLNVIGHLIPDPDLSEMWPTPENEKARVDLAKHKLWRFCKLMSTGGREFSWKKRPSDPTDRFSDILNLTEVHGLNVPVDIDFAFNKEPAFTMHLDGKKHAELRRYKPRVEALDFDITLSNTAHLNPALLGFWEKWFVLPCNPIINYFRILETDSDLPGEDKDIADEIGKFQTTLGIPELNHPFYVMVSRLINYGLKPRKINPVPTLTKIFHTYFLKNGVTKNIDIEMGKILTDGGYIHLGDAMDDDEKHLLTSILSVLTGDMIPLKRRLGLHKPAERSLLLKHALDAKNIEASVLLVNAGEERKYNFDNLLVRVGVLEDSDTFCVDHLKRIFKTNDLAFITFCFEKMKANELWRPFLEMALSCVDEYSLETQEHILFNAPFIDWSREALSGKASKNLNPIYLAMHWGRADLLPKIFNKIGATVEQIKNFAETDLYLFDLIVSDAIHDPSEETMACKNAPYSLAFFLATGAQPNVERILKEIPLSGFSVLYVRAAIDPKALTATTTEIISLLIKAGDTFLENLMTVNLKASLLSNDLSIIDRSFATLAKYHGPWHVSLHDTLMPVRACSGDIKAHILVNAPFIVWSKEHILGTNYVTGCHPTKWVIRWGDADLLQAVFERIGLSTEQIKEYAESNREIFDDLF